MGYFRYLDRLAPTVAEVWAVGALIVYPFVCLALARLWLLTQLERVQWPDDAVLVQLGEAEFWGLFAALVLILSRLPGRHTRTVVRLGAHTIAVLILVASLLDLLFFQITGGRADLDSVEYAVAEFSRVWPVVGSEVTGRDWAALAAIGAGSFLPLLWTPASTNRRWWTRLALLALYPAVLNGTYGRFATSREVRPLQKTLTVALFREALNRRDDLVIEPTAAELAPIRISSPTRPHNVVVVLLESVGLKHTTLRDATIKSTPNLARLADEGLKVESMYAVIPHTTKALVSTLCGDWPEPVGDADEARPGGLPDRCLPALLRERGYRTAFFQPARGDFEDRADLVHEMGFERFRAQESLAQRTWERSNYLGIDDRAMLAPGLQWSTEDKDRPFFATYLTLASHHDYRVPSHWTLLDFPGVGGRLERYLNAVRYVDDFLGRLVRGYEELGLAEDTVFVVLGDHGEGFGEHGRSQHDLTIYEEGLQVPAVIWSPAILAGRTGVITGNRQQIDVLPTVLELIGAESTDRTLRGSSLLGPAPEGRTLFHACWRSHRCIASRTGSDKFIDHYGDQPEQHFDLDSDPREDESIALTPNDSAARRAALRRWYGAVRGRYAERRRVWLETIQRPDASPALARWGSVSLLGCQVETAAVTPGEPVWVSCRWRAERPLAEPLTLVAQLDRAGLMAEKRATPHMGLFSMWDWRPGWSIDDKFSVSVPPTAAVGTATLSVGWSRVTGDVLATDDGRERVDVGTVEVLARRKVSSAGVEGIRLRNPPDPDASFDLRPLR